MKKRVLSLLLISVCLLTLIGCGKKEEETNKEESIKIEYDGVNITPGEKLKIDKISKDYDKSEVPDCAFGGKGIIYTFDDLEISTNEDDLIYSVYFIDPNMKTLEGISLGDSFDSVKEKYKGTESDGVYKYSKGKVEIDFTINGDIVSSIEYLLVD